ncbi:MAG: hypothetical protein JWN40_5151 [Phycisphaerales bacterium]|nr:hypothetical protein [Phycisphaerales bacterium]
MVTSGDHVGRLWCMTGCFFGFRGGEMPARGCYNAILRIAVKPPRPAGAVARVLGYPDVSILFAPPSISV